MISAFNIYYAGLIFWWITEGYIILRDVGKVHTRKDNFSTVIILLTILVGNYLANTLGDITYHPIIGTSAQHFVIGGIIIFIGVSFRIWSVFTLGKFFRTTVMVQEKHKVITYGPYKYVRHPSYLGILIAIIGSGIAIENWLGLLYLFVFIYFGLAYRISVEENVLQSDLGKPYEDYMKRTKKLIPFLY